ncbi:hypothetical protein MMSP_1219 [Mycobacterium sp. 012931]|nr:hypothetical protein MMSP_1219 [Mycobacterium sp. 012931]EPQ71727.1 hypothetical protein MMEU_3109 [Mycobacterium marinum str. Europe]
MRYRRVWAEFVLFFSTTQPRCYWPAPTNALVRWDSSRY